MLQQTLLYGLTFISGLFFGSFLNLVSDRVVKGESIIFGRSKCDHCKKPLQLKNLFPIISYLLQKGKCSYCKKNLSWTYPLSEFLTGLTFIGVAYFIGIFRNFNISLLIIFLYLLIMASFFLVLFFTDMKYRLIPDQIVYPAIIFSLLFIILNSVVVFVLYYNQLKGDDFGRYLLEAGYLKLQIFNALKSFGILLASAFGIGLFFWFLVFITKGKGMGGGDIRLGFLIGIFNGFPYNMLAIFLGFVVGATVSLVLILLGKKTLKDTIAFGPFLIIGSLISLVWGPQLVNLYLKLF